MERRYDTGPTIFATHYAKKDWHARLGGRAHADAIMDRIVHNAIWIDTGEINMREHTPPKRLRPSADPHRHAGARGRGADTHQPWPPLAPQPVPTHTNHGT